MIVRRIAAILFLPMMFAFGAGVYLYLGTMKSKVVKERAQLPTVTKPRFVLPGTMYVAQEGRLFKLNAGSFTEIGPPGDWSQPALTPDHSKMIAVSRSGFYSDLYLLDLNGHVIKRLTKNDSRIIDGNHWVFYPKVSPDGATLTYSFDSPKYGYQVDMAVWSMPLSGTQAQARRRTTPNDHTGGDVSPIPLAGGGILFVRHSIEASTAVTSQIYYQSHPFAIPKALTSEADDCSQPALSPDGTQLAMICTGGKQTARLEVAPFTGSSLGPAKVFLDGRLFAAPAWSPDGKALAYFAPSGAAGHFQLWYLVLPDLAPPASASASTSAAPSIGGSPSVRPSASPSPPAPVQVTQGVDLSATSAPAWF